MSDTERIITRALVVEFGKQIYAPKPAPILIEEGSEFDRECREILQRFESAVASDKDAET